MAVLCNRYCMCSICFKEKKTARTINYFVMLQVSDKIVTKDCSGFIGL